MLWDKLFRLSDLQNDYSLLEDILEIAYDEFVSYYKTLCDSRICQ